MDNYGLLPSTSVSIPTASTRRFNENRQKHGRTSSSFAAHAKQPPESGVVVRRKISGKVAKRVVAPGNERSSSLHTPHEPTIHASLHKADSLSAVEQPPPSNYTPLPRRADVPVAPKASAIAVGPKKGFPLRPAPQQKKEQSPRQPSLENRTIVAASPHGKQSQRKNQTPLPTPSKMSTNPQRHNTDQALLKYHSRKDSRISLEPQSCC